MDFNDCVYSKNKDGSLMVGGYKLDNILSNSPVMFSNTNTKDHIYDYDDSGSDSGSDKDTKNTSKNNQDMKGGNFSKVFSDLAVPAGLLYLQQNYNTKNSFVNGITEKVGIIKDDLYDNLINIVSNNKKMKHNIKTRRNNNKKNKKTRKN
jgi:hypothetical protein